MKYLLQTGCKELQFEMQQVESLLKEKRNSLISDVYYSTLEDLDEGIAGNIIPIGTIEFVETYLRLTVPGFEKENPIEIPEAISSWHNCYLGRDYKIVPYEEIPKEGRFFLKDVSTLKKFARIVRFPEELSILEELDKTALYQVSEVLDVLSEWRVYVIDGKVENVCCYNGDAAMPPEEYFLKAIEEIMRNPELNKQEWLKSFTIDVAVYKGMDYKHKSAVLEVHNFTSVGLYSTLWGDNLLLAYRQGIDYLIHDNRKLKPMIISGK